jgi:deazaflavin-dependent oxidoreductase (nitroreductase family)
VGVDRAAGSGGGGRRPNLGRPSLCYLTTTGRVSGRPHRIEIWFVHHQGTVYLLSGGGERSDWVRNLKRTSAVTVRIGGHDYPGTARLVTDPGEDRLARDLIFDKYSRRYSDDLEEWREASLPVAIDLDR